MSGSACGKGGILLFDRISSQLREKRELIVLRALVRLWFYV